MPCARQAKTLAAEVVRYRRNLDEHRRVWQFDGPQARRVDEDRNRRWAFGRWAAVQHSSQEVETNADA